MQTGALGGIDGGGPARWIFGRARWSLALLITLGAPGCKDEPRSLEMARGSPSPSPGDHGAVCADVGDVRACWSGSSSETVSSRPVPAGATPPDGWRCEGTGAGRTCEERHHNGQAFACAGSRCVQPRPRMPDDGEWECVDMAGVVFCRNRTDAAGLPSGPMDPGWICGARRDGGTGERVCVDLDPDRPTGGGTWRCVLDISHGPVERVCEPAAAPVVGAPCATDRACPEGSGCAGARCIPHLPAPSCWLDGDCGSGARCRWGTCDSTSRP